MKPLRDDELRACFHRLRQHDAAHVPDFPALTQRRDARERWFAPTLVGLAAAAGLVIAATSTLRWVHDRNARRELPSISSWTSPTASLLNVADRELLAPPPILSSVFDGVTRRAIMPKGD